MSEFVYTDTDILNGEKLSLSARARVLKVCERHILQAVCGNLTKFTI